ncbi:MAG: DUF459 domain-containing protein [Proteobacteria bacterium]|nr:DUF459 domain-containing protein [Pseudomonadota bacterium]
MKWSTPAAVCLFASLAWSAVAGAQDTTPAQPITSAPVTSAQQAPAPITSSPTASPGPAAASNKEPERFGGRDGVFRMVVIGDTLARGLGAGLDRLTELDPRIEVIGRNNEASGLARPEVYDWPAALPKILEDGTIDAVIVFLGINDRQPIKVGANRVEFGTPQWQAAYRIKTDSLIRRIKAGGAKVYWLNLPPMGDPQFNSDMRMIADIHRERVSREEGQFLDINADLSAPGGGYTDSDTDEKGKARRLRNKDGINFSRAGNNLLGDLVMSSIRLREGAAELASSKETDEIEAPAEQQVAIAAPPKANSPLFGQSGVDDASVTFEATAITSTPVQNLAPDTSTLGKLGIKVARNSLALRFYRSGEVIGAPRGRFDDFSIPQTPSQ